MKSPKYKTRNYKTLEENISRTFDDINQSKILHDPHPRVMEIKTTSFCTAKETISRMKRKPSEWEKIIANETDKGLISKIYKQLIQLNARKTTTTTKKKKQSKSGKKT